MTANTATVSSLDEQQAALTGDQTVESFVEWMQSIGCFQGKEQRLGYWPAALRVQMVFALVDLGLLTKKSFGPGTYNHTEYYLAAQ